MPLEDWFTPEDQAPTPKLVTADGAVCVDRILPVAGGSIYRDTEILSAAGTGSRNVAGHDEWMQKSQLVFWRGEKPSCSVRYFGCARGSGQTLARSTSEMSIVFPKRSRPVLTINRVDRRHNLSPQFTKCPQLSCLTLKLLEIFIFAPKV